MAKTLKLELHSSQQPRDAIVIHMQKKEKHYERLVSLSKGMERATALGALTAVRFLIKDLQDAEIVYYP